MTVDTITVLKDVIAIMSLSLPASGCHVPVRHDAHGPNHRMVSLTSSETLVSHFLPQPL